MTYEAIKTRTLLTHRLENSIDIDSVLKKYLQNLEDRIRLHPFNAPLYTNSDIVQTLRFFNFYI